ncbi:MAG: molybdopterin guanine dinucleotide synthesis [Marivita sp.]|uniref:molybdopterin guanine dinucleotide synthesis n=1 Tax=Marivita sp. TaxID=2003365 RepID=UPI003EF9FBE9
MNGFDTMIVVDWSGGLDRGPRPKKDAIWAAVVRHGVAERPVYHRNRRDAEHWLGTLIGQELACDRRVFAGFDFPFGYPAGFASALTGTDDPLTIWAWLEAHIEDAPHQTNRWEIAGRINGLFPGIGPFWGNGRPNQDVENLPRKGNDRRDHGVAEWRAAERATKGAFSCWQLAGAGSVGSQMLMGLPVLERLRRRFDTAIWPFQRLDRPLAIVEVWPSLIADFIGATMPEGEIRDAHQVRVLAGAIAALPDNDLARMLLVDDPSAHEEGWIFGVGHEDQLRSAADLGLSALAEPAGVRAGSSKRRSRSDHTYVSDPTSGRMA